MIETRLQKVIDAQTLANFYRDNDAHLKQWEPQRPAGYHSVESWQHRLEHLETEKKSWQSAHFLSYCYQTQSVAAVCSLTNIQFGHIKSCNMGYAAAKTHEGKGIMRALCQHVIEFAFQDLQLHNIAACYLPRNHRSAGLLKRLGFEQEGIAKEYLQINGRLEDHMLVSLINSSLHQNGVYEF